MCVVCVCVYLFFSALRSLVTATQVKYWLWWWINIANFIYMYDSLLEWNYVVHIYGSCLQGCMFLFCLYMFLGALHLMLERKLKCIVVTMKMMKYVWNNFNAQNKKYIISFTDAVLKWEGFIDSFGPIDKVIIKNFVSPAVPTCCCSKSLSSGWQWYNYKEWSSYSLYRWFSGQQVYLRICMCAFITKWVVVCM